MKTRIFTALLSLTVLLSLAACGGNAPTAAAGSTQPDTQTETPAEPEAPTVELLPVSDPAEPDPADTRYAFGQVLWDAYLQGLLPDGSVLDWTDTEGAAENDFALYDVDGDGQEELLLYWTNASMAGMGLRVFGYADGAVYEELLAFPMVTFYDNGIVEEGWSHNHGLASNRDFWPYSFHRYNVETDTYDFADSADAWAEDYPATSDTFPAELDTDGDGMVYFLLPAGESWHYEGDHFAYTPVDGPEYEAWRSSYLDGAQPLDIASHTQKLTEDHIAALGCPKPDVPTVEPAG